VRRIAGAADEQGRAVGAERKRRDQPHAVDGVVRDRRVGGPGVAALWPRERRQGGEEAVLPAPPAVTRDREADVRGPAVEDPADLEDGDDRRPVGRRVGLDLGLVPAVGVAVRVARDLPRDELAVGADTVEQVDRRQVASPPAGDEVANAIDGLNPVGAARAADPRRPGCGRAEEEKCGEDESCSFQLLPPGPPPSGSRNGYR
jgi:hypothetical protein